MRFIVLKFSGPCWVLTLSWLLFLTLKVPNKNPFVRASICLSVCLSLYLLLNHWRKRNQIWYVSYSHEWGVQQHNFFCPVPWGPGEGPKDQISLNFKANFKDFIPNFVCLLANKTHQMGFSFSRLGHTRGVGLGALWGGGMGGVKI